MHSRAAAALRVNHAVKQKARPLSARPATAAKVCVSGPAAIGVKDTKRTGYVPPAPFQIKKSVKPLTSVQAFSLQTASLASKDVRERENSNTTQGASSSRLVSQLAAKAGAAAAVTPKRSVKSTTTKVCLQ